MVYEKLQKKKNSFQHENDPKTFLNHVKISSNQKEKETKSWKFWLCHITLLISLPWISLGWIWYSVGKRIHKEWEWEWTFSVLEQWSERSGIN